jgi:hypothetical protein
MKETDVLHMFLARADNYEVTNIKHSRGRAYSVVMEGKGYNAVVLLNSFDYYARQYHIAKQRPDLIICYVHDTVVPIKVLSMRVGNLAEAYELPEDIEDVEAQRYSRTGSRVLLGMYISGLRRAQDIIKGLKSPTTRKRYLQKAKGLGKRRRGRPVDTQKQKGKEEK